MVFESKSKLPTVQIHRPPVSTLEASPPPAMPPPLPAHGGSVARAASIRLLCTAVAPPEAASLSHVLALPPIARSPDADELARVLLAHHNPFHPAESPLQLLSGGGVSLTGDLLVQLLLRLRGASKLALSLLHAARLHPSLNSLPSTMLILGSSLQCMDL